MNSVSTNAPKVIALVLTWNDTEMTARCLESVLALDYPNLGVILVDNGTVPPACPILKARFPSIETIQLPENTGFTGGNNRGLTRALEMGADYIFLLNNDTIVHRDSARELVRVMEERRDIGQASAILLDPGEAQTIGFTTIHLNRTLTWQTREGEGEKLGPQHRRNYDTDFVPACAVMLRPAALRQIGLFDETLFTNWEDYDFCCRLADGGWKTVMVGTAEVIHAHGATTGRISPFITYLGTRNRLICLFRYGKPWAILLRSPRILRQFYWQMKGYGLTNWPAHRAFLRGVVDFLTGVRGKGNVPTERRDRIKTEAA
ncbi:MAG: glycosyltransferase family 2 protein [Rubrivivax sp.]|nr:glycosyltransferase family 2 protein [Rubrivivax sp.]